MFWKPTTKELGSLLSLESKDFLVEKDKPYHYLHSEYTFIRYGHTPRFVYKHFGNSIPVFLGYNGMAFTYEPYPGCGEGDLQPCVLHYRTKEDILDILGLTADLQLIKYPLR